MRRKQIINVLIILIGLVLLIDIAMIFFNNKKIDLLESFESENKKETFPINYLCYGKIQNNNINDIQYESKEEYSFTLYQKEIRNYLYKNILAFQNIEDYKEYKEKYSIHENNFDKIYQDENNKIIYTNKMIYMADTINDLSFSESYLNFLKEKGYECSIISELDN